MKLPGSTLIPCRNQMAPKTTSKPPTMFKVIFMFTAEGCGLNIFSRSS